MPAVLLLALSYTVADIRVRGYANTLAGIALVLALTYVTLQVRRVFHGPVLHGGETSDAEQYTYSAVWLVLGVVLLAVGYILRATSVRIASAAVVILTILKVFFVDMRDLTGLWQALSVLGLGVVLLGIGWFYQRLLFPRRVPAPPSPT
jgi:uncharacterized membrane protein